MSKIPKNWKPNKKQRAVLESDVKWFVEWLRSPRADSSLSQIELKRLESIIMYDEACHHLKNDFDKLTKKLRQDST